MLEAFHFLRPWWLVAGLPAIALLILVWRAGDASRAWRGIVAPHLLKHLLSRGDKRERIRPLGVLALIWILCVLALAGPAWRRDPSPFADEKAAMVIVLKATDTMQARDIQPSRQQRAAQKLKDLLDLRPGARVGLVVYAGSAHLVMPVTKDRSVVASMLTELSSDIMPREGDAAAKAIQLAEEHLQRSGQRGSMLLVADEVDLVQRKILATERERGSTPVHVYAVAAPADAPVPPGSPPAPPLDLPGMKEAARAGRGDLVVVTPDTRDLEQLVALAETRFSVGAIAGEEGGETSWRDAGFWLVPCILLLVLCWARPGWSVRWPTLGLLLGLIITPPAEAGGFKEVWVTPDQQAQIKYNQEAYREAAQLFTDPMRRGVAWYMAGDFEAAVASFGRVPTAEGQFNRANALVMLGQYEQAITGYDQALEKRPDWEEAKDNRRIARVRAERLKRPDDDHGGTGGMLEADEIVFDESGKSPPGSDQEEEQVQGDQVLSDQEIQAMWLRRVQTRPADFLSVKFAYQLSREAEE